MRPGNAVSSALRKYSKPTGTAIDTSQSTPRLRIVHIITKGVPMGGAQLNTLYSLRYQHQSHDVAAILGSDGPLAEACADCGIVSYVIPFQNRLLDPFGDLRAVIGMVRLLRRLRPDIVHTHSSKAGVLGRLAARLAGTPVVVHTIHVLPYHDQQPRVLQTILAAIERACARLTDEIVAVADTLAEDFIVRGIIGRDRIHTVVSGIDFKDFPANRDAIRSRVRRELDIGAGEGVVISVANLEPRKRLDVLVEAVSRLRTRGIHARVLLVGEGEMEQSLRLQAQSAGLSDTLQFLGRRVDVPELLAASDVFVQTSQLEGLSRSLVEALYSGLAVVATDVNATHEVVRNGETGWLIKAGDIDALTERLSAILSNSEAARVLGERARREIGDSRSVDAMGRQLESVYRIALLRKRGKGTARAKIGGRA